MKRSLMVLLSAVVFAGLSLPSHSAPKDTVGADVRDFGAKGDGVADDSAAIQAAVDSVRKTGGLVDIPPGTYLIGEPIRLPSGIRLEGAARSATILVARGDFRGDAMLQGDGSQPFVRGLVIEHMTFQGAGRVAAFSAVSGILEAAQLRDLWLKTNRGLVLDTYTQGAVIENIATCGPIDQILHLRGNWNFIRGIDKECGSGGSADPYILIDAYPGGRSTGNHLQGLLIEGDGAPGKTALKLDQAVETTIEDVWWELRKASSGYAIDISGSTGIYIKGFLVHLIPGLSGVRIADSSWVTVEKLNINAKDATIKDYVSVDKSSHLHVREVDSRRGADVLGLGMRENVSVDRVVAMQWLGKDERLAPVFSAPFFVPQNMLVNPSFEAGAFGWSVVARPLLEEYPASDVGPGRMAHFRWKAGQTASLSQRLPPLTPEQAANQLSFSCLVRAEGKGQVEIEVSGPNTGGYVPVHAGGGWHVLSATFRAAPGPFAAGVRAIAGDADLDLFIDECRLSFGDVPALNPAKFASLELNGATLTSLPAPPTSGTWKKGDVVFASDPGAAKAAGWVCTADGAPGEWTPFGTSRGVAARNVVLWGDGADVRRAKGDDVCAEAALRCRETRSPNGARGDCRTPRGDVFYALCE